MFRGGAVLSIVGLLALGAMGCEPRVSLGGSCVYNSECGGLFCLYGRCRAQCVADVDCSGGGLVCNSGVCARPEESCSASDPCESPELSCAGSICATRCSPEATCAGDSTCEPRVGGLVCVPRLDVDAGPLDGGALDAAIAPVGVRDLCVGRYYACVARVDGTVACWGVGTSGELGGGAPLTEGEPGVLPCEPFGVTGNLCSTELVTVVDSLGAPITDVVSLACGERTTLAHTSTGRLYSWGLGSNGELGRPFPGAMSAHAVADWVTDAAGTPLEGVIDMTIGRLHGCARLADGTTRCWGAWDDRYRYGQLGTGTTAPPDEFGSVEATVLAGALELSAADENTCAVDPTGVVVCVGSNESAAAGATSEARVVPVLAPNPVAGIVGRPSDLVAGSAFFCALADLTVYCWGQAGEGSLGRGDLDPSYEARCPPGEGNFTCDPAAAAVVGGRSFTALAGGPQASTVCGIAGGRVHCWGQSEAGSAGSIGRLVAPGGPILRAEDGNPLEDVRLARVGGATSCAFTSSDELYCWGSNQAAHFRTAPDTLVHDRAVRVLLD